VPFIPPLLLVAEEGICPDWGLFAERAGEDIAEAVPIIDVWIFSGRFSLLISRGIEMKPR
jgi:hypothetical protein